MWGAENSRRFVNCCSRLVNLFVRFARARPFPRGPSTLFGIENTKQQPDTPS